MQQKLERIGWIGMGRMGYPMADRLVGAGHDVRVWNRTKAKAEPLAERGATVVENLNDLAGVDVLFTMVSTGRDLDQVLFGDGGVVANGGDERPGICVDCSSIGVDESAELRARLEALGTEYMAAPVSGNGKCAKAGKLSVVASGPEPVFKRVRGYLGTIAGNGVAYVGEGELARICKIAHNVFLGTVIRSLSEITVLAEKAGVPRHAFLEFMNNSVMGSIFTRYKTPALVNLDWTTTFTPALLRKDLDLGLELGRTFDVPMPVTATTREALQAHFGAARLKNDPEAYLQQDFAAILETVALGAGLSLVSEDKPVKTGLEPALDET